MSAALRLRQSTSAPLSLLISRYLTEQISQSAWAQFAGTFDAAGATTEERAAFVRYFYEAGDEGLMDIEPDAEDMREVLLLLRATA